METVLMRDIVERGLEKIQKERTIPVEASGRHVHLSRQHIGQLFGEHYQMTKKKDLSQPGQFQCNERVTLIGPKGVLQGVAILGPARDRTQVEVSISDARVLGIAPPVRESGHLDGAGSIYIAAEKAVIEARESVIISKRHIHMTPADAARFDVKDRQIVSVRVKGERSIVFEDVVVRVNDAYRLNMHIDFDEANAAGFCPGVVGEVIL